MVLSTHAVVGATAASFFPHNPILAFSIAFVSHFCIDPIPHWDYKLHSMVHDPDDILKTDMLLGKNFIFDLIKIATDALLGLLVSLVLFLYVTHSTNLMTILIGVIAGILPDPLQFLYWKTRSKILLPLQKFHTWIHGRSLEIHPSLGATLQVVIISLVFVVSLYFKQ